MFFLLSRKDTLQEKNCSSPNIKFAEKTQGYVWLEEESGFLYNGT